MEKQLLRFLIVCAIVVPYCFITYLSLLRFAVPRLLNTRSTISTYPGFYIQYPNLVGKVSGLQCVTNGQRDADYGYSYSCRFNVNLSNIEQFIREKQLLAQDFEACLDIDVATNMGKYSPAPSWKPSDLEVGGECYASGQFANDSMLLLYSPTSQLAYMQEND
ncbi:hypothetical protein [Trichocoleus sp. FACHB-262]|uniref:hypothetical protein n=1 Tax=Trichocoleus sp. FACHB-262 TaxID=2692869 RepID=UPI001684079C|nr:hypothetical protein [Trichocoleus sp. FACHB-262]MBD2123945.1 hypothetical protein [Trichocoleus sp. FACHB-262]